MARKKYTQEFRSKAALTAIHGGEMANETASRFGAHPGRVREKVLDKDWPWEVNHAPPVCSAKVPLW